jgi:EmrB/QacA subfamily drug resistance transporter
MDLPVNKRTALLVTTTGSFLTPFMGSSVNIALPAIGREFTMDAVLLSWVSSSYILAAAMFLVPFGRIADIYGRKKILNWGMMLYTLSSCLCGISHSPLMLIASRILQGVGSAMTFSTGMAIVTSIFPEGERGKAIGINVASVYLGLSLGPFFGGFLTEHLGWRSIFLITVPLGLIVVGAIYWKREGEWAAARGEKFDFFGSVIYSLTLVAIMYGFTLLPGKSGGAVILLGILGLWAFIRWELRMKSPVLNINLFRKSRVFALSNLAALINYSATFGVGFLLSMYLQYIKGYSPLHAGSILALQPATQTALSPFAGRLSDRVEPQIVASMGMGFTVAGLSLLTFLHENTGLEFILTSLFLLGVGFALFSSPNTNAVMSSVEKAFLGVASGTLATMRVIGQMLSMGIATLLFAVYIGRVQITAASYPAFLQSARTAFFIFAALCFGGIFASLARGKVR